MAIAYIIEIPGMNQEQSAAVLRELGLTNTPPAGQILHIEGPMEGGGHPRCRRLGVAGGVRRFHTRPAPASVREGRGHLAPRPPTDGRLARQRHLEVASPGLHTRSASVLRGNPLIAVAPCLHLLVPMRWWWSCTSGHRGRGL